MQPIAALTVATSAAADPEANALPILPYLPELIIGLIIFALYYLIIRKYVFPAVEKMYSERKAAIEGGMSKAEDTQREAEKVLREYQAQLADARDESARIREDAREQGAAIIAEMREQAQAEADRITTNAHKQIEAERSQAFVSLRSEVGRLSTDLASRIVGESLHEETRRTGIVDRFLAELESGTIRPTAHGQADSHGSDGPGGSVGEAAPARSGATALGDGQETS